MRQTRRRTAQRGSAMLVTLIIVSALIAGGAVLVSMQMSSNRGAEVTNTGVTALYCAEAGLAAARPVVIAQYLQWTGNLGTGTEPSWLSAIDHDVDNDGATSPDFTITLKDNDDELTATNDLTVDQDLRIWVVSTCNLFPETPKQVMELVRYSGGGQRYKAQAGGNAGNGNDN